MASSFIPRLWKSVFAAILLAAVPAAASAQVTVLYDFKNGADGLAPHGSLIRDSAGALYGTYGPGGSPTAIVGIFKLTPPLPGQTQWVKTTLYEIKSGAGGVFTRAGLVKDAKGNLYGTVTIGGGAGTVFKLAPPAAGQTQWTMTTLYTFKGSADGDGPGDGSLVIDGNLALYGTTVGGGSGGAGTVFKLTPPAPGQTLWTKATLYNFSGAGGGNPVAGLVRDQQGVLYGATQNGGGSPGYGLVYSLTPPRAGSSVWTYRTLYAFKGGADGQLPTGTLLLTGKGALYGTTWNGGIVTPYPGQNGNGTAFKLTPPGPGETQWTKTTLYSFKGRPDSGGPQGGLAFAPAGVLVGTTTWGGTSGSYAGANTSGGTVYKLTPPPTGKTQWTETVVRSFQVGPAIDPQNPASSLLAGPQGELYGTSTNGGTCNCGTVFRVQP